MGSCRLGLQVSRHCRARAPTPASAVGPAQGEGCQGFSPTVAWPGGEGYLLTARRFRTSLTQIPNLFGWICVRQQLALVPETRIPRVPRVSAQSRNDPLPNPRAHR